MKTGLTQDAGLETETEGAGAFWAEKRHWLVCTHDIPLSRIAHGPCVAAVQLLESGSAFRLESQLHRRARPGQSLEELKPDKGSLPATRRI